MNKQQPQEVDIKLKTITLHGNLSIPQNATGLILFAHGSGSSRFSPRNNTVADYLNNSGFATLLFDLLTDEEELVDRETREYRFDIPMLAERLESVTDWVKEQPELQNFFIGYFGSSTGAAAALIAAANRPDSIRAVVSRGGRPDLAGEALPRVKAPTVLIVGGLDGAVIDLNQDAKAQMSKNTEIKIVPGATHLFEEPGKLDEVVKLAGEWFKDHLVD